MKASSEDIADGTESLHGLGGALSPAPFLFVASFPGIKFIDAIHVPEGGGPGLLGDCKEPDHGMVGRCHLHVSMVDVTDHVLHVALSSANPYISDNDIVIGDGGFPALDGHGFSLGAGGQSLQLHEPMAFFISLHGEVPGGKPDPYVFPGFRISPDSDGLVALDNHVITEEMSYGQLSPGEAGKGQKKKSEGEGQLAFHGRAIACPAEKGNNPRGHDFPGKRPVSRGLRSRSRLDQDSQRIKTEPVRETGSSENRRDCEMHFKPPALLLGTLGLFFLMPLVVDAAHEKGLILRLGSPGGSSDARVARSVALHVPSGQSPSPFLKAGSFTARWEGKLVLEKRSRLVFHLEGRGQAKLLIDGEVLVEAIGSPSESERLRSGEHEFLVEYIPPPEGEATLQLWWEGRDFGKEPMPANVFRHDPEDKVLQRQSSFRRGRMLVAEKRCGSCHDSGTEEIMPELRLQAPSLDDIGNRLQADWLVRWISNPESLRPHARMPAVFHGEDAQQKAAHIAAYLVAGGSHPEKNDEHSPGEIREGGKIFHQQGCIACHTLDRKGDGERIGLGGVRQKFRQWALAGFLQKPSRFHEGTRLPSFRFSAKEAASVASFLRSVGEEPEEEPLRGDPARGQMLARSTGCFNCHQRKGEKAAEVSKLGLF